MKRRVARGVLHPELRSVYRVGHRAPSVEAWYMAAVLACGEGAALSGPVPPAPARARGDEHRRYTYGNVVDEPEPMLAEPRQLLWRHRRHLG